MQIDTKWKNGYKLFDSIFLSVEERNMNRSNVNGSRREETAGM